MSNCPTAPTGKADPAEGVRPIAARLLDVNQVAMLLGVCVATIERLDAAGRLPSPVRLTRYKRWDLAELNLWLKHKTPAGDLPDRKAWAAMYVALQKAGRT